MFEEELVNSAAESWFGGVQPVEVGSLDDVKEERQVIPATKGAKFQVVKAEATSNKDFSYRSINMHLKLVDGLADGKYKNKIVFARVCYYADPNIYKKEFFQKKQHLIQLKYLKRAVGYESNTVDGHFLDACLHKQILADITIKKRQILLDDGQGGKVAEETQDNEAKNFKAIPAEQSI